MIVGLCDTQIGDNPPIVTKKFTKTKTKKSVKKSADFFSSGKVGRLFGRWGNRLVGHKLKPPHYWSVPDRLLADTRQSRV